MGKTVVVTLTAAQAGEEIAKPSRTARSSSSVGIDKPPFAPYTDARMIWIAPSEKDAANDALEKRLWAAANQLWAGAGLKPDGAAYPGFTASDCEIISTDETDYEVR